MKTIKQLKSELAKMPVPSQLISESELCDFLHVSRTTCWRIRKSGLLDDCIYIVGMRSVRYDANKVLVVLKQNNKMPWAVKQ